MERHPMFMNWKTILLIWQYYPNNLQVQCNPHQNSNSLVPINGKAYPKVPVEMQGTQNSQKSWKRKIKLKYPFTDFKT